MNIKKLLFIWIALFLGAMTPTVVIAANPIVRNIDVNGTNYDFTYTSGSFLANYQLLISQPWFTPLSSASATTFATALNSQLGQVQGAFGPLFAYRINGVDSETRDIAWNGTGVEELLRMSTTTVYSYAVVTPSAVAPEMNASLIPQIALLLVCLFFLLGRKKEVFEPFLTA